MKPIQKNILICIDCKQHKIKQLFFLLIFINYSIYAQSYVPGKILFKDGKELNGYVENFNFSSYERGFNGIEKSLGLARKRIKFKSSKKAKREYLDIAKININYILN